MVKKPLREQRWKNKNENNKLSLCRWRSDNNNVVVTRSHRGIIIITRIIQVKVVISRGR